MAQYEYLDLTGLKTFKTNLESVMDSKDNAVLETVDSKVSTAIAQVVADAPEDFDTLKEISDWISSHADSAAAMNTQITENASAIADLQALVGSLTDLGDSTTLVDYINQLIENEDSTLSQSISDAEQSAKDYADSLAENYATAEQGAKADTAVQSVTTGTTNGTIAVDGTDVAVYGLGSAAYTDSSAYDAAGTAASLIDAMDTYTAITDDEITALFE